MPSRRHVLAASAATGAVALAAACSPSSSGDTEGGEADGKTLTFRLWDEVALPAYEKSLKAFSEQSEWNVSIDVVSWDDYWTKLPLDVASGDAADVYWVNTSNFLQLQQGGNILAIDDVVTENVDLWDEAVKDLYTEEGKLWGVPQLWDSIALFYNKELLEEAGVDPADLAFDPSADTDSLREAGRALTRDEEDRHPGDEGFSADARTHFAFNSQYDYQAIVGPFIANGGAQWSKDEQYAFASEKGSEVVQYLADLVNEDLIAPSAADTNENGDIARDLFVQGKLALFQSGPYSLAPIAEGVGDSFEWAIAPLVSGPEGSGSVVHGVAAVGNADAPEDKQEGIAELLTWLGSAEGQRPIAEEGVAFPGNTDAQDAFLSYWADKGLDVEVFIDATDDPVPPSNVGAKATAGDTAIAPFFQEIFIGRSSASDALPEAQDAGNEAIG